MIVYLNGNFKELKDAKISSLDHSFLYGDGVFDTLRAYNGRIFKIEEHIERLKNAADILEIKTFHIFTEKILHRLLNLNKIKDATIRLTISRGEGPRGIDPDLCKTPNVVVVAEEFKGYPDIWYKNGISATILNIRKPHPKSFPSIKSNNYLPNILAKIEAKKRNADDGIFLTIDNYIACGITSNIFIVKGDKLITPQLSIGILPGITRKTIIEIAKSIGIPIFERKFKKDVLFEADEVFLTSTGYEVMPVAKIDDYKIKAPGELTNKLLCLYREKISLESEVKSLESRE